MGVAGECRPWCERENTLFLGGVDEAAGWVWRFCLIWPSRFGWHSMTLGRCRNLHDFSFVVLRIHVGSLQAAMLL